MRLSRSDLMALMQWVDGEADPETQAKAEALVHRNSEARMFVRELSSAGDAVREVTERAPAGLDVADAVLAKIEAEEGRAVISLSAERAKRRRVAGFVTVGLAAAAVFAVYFRPHADLGARGLGSGDTLAVSTSVAPMDSARIGAAPADSQEVRVVGGSGVSVFYSQDTQAAASSVVVWVSEENEK